MGFIEFVASLNESSSKKIKWEKSDDGYRAEWLGRNLEIKVSKETLPVYTGYIDGELVKTIKSRTYGELEKLQWILQNEVSDSPLTSKAIKSVIDHVKARMKIKDLNGWEWNHIGAGDYFGKNKSKAISLQLTKRIYPDKKDVGPKQVPAGPHNFMIQAFFEPGSERKGRVDYWLDQGGQIISIGLSHVNFEQGDLESFISSIKTAAKISDSDLIRELYKSGYHNYGRF